MTKIFLLPILIAIFLSTTLAFDLTGDWRPSTGENVYIRQVNNTIWYYGESAAAKNENWTSVGYGTVEGNTVKDELGRCAQGECNFDGNRRAECHLGQRDASGKPDRRMGQRGSQAD